MPSRSATWRRSRWCSETATRTPCSSSMRRPPSRRRRMWRRPAGRGWPRLAVRRSHAGWAVTTPPTRLRTAPLCPPIPRPRKPSAPFSMSSAITRGRRCSRRCRRRSPRHSGPTRRPRGPSSPGRSPRAAASSPSPKPRTCWLRTVSRWSRRASCARSRTCLRLPPPSATPWRSRFSRPTYRTSPTWAAWPWISGMTSSCSRLHAPCSRAVGRSSRRPRSRASRFRR